MDEDEDGGKEKYGQTNQGSALAALITHHEPLTEML